MRYVSVTSAVELRRKYPVIIGWGARNEISRINSDGVKFPLDFLVDGKNNNVGETIGGFVVSDLSVIEKYRNTSSLLVVIFPNIEPEIMPQVSECLPLADTISARLISADGFRQTYSNAKEDIFIFDHLTREHKEITYMDIGVCHPVVRNNTFLFYEQGYTDGVLVEPNPDMCELSRIYRPENRIINCGAACDDTQTGLDYYFNPMNPGLNTFVKELAQKRGLLDSHTVIPVTNINQIINENFKDGKLSFLDIDTEGMDLSLLRALDTASFRIDLICAETYVYVGNSKTSAAEMMDKKGYRLLATIEANEIYIRK